MFLEDPTKSWCANGRQWHKRRKLLVCVLRCQLWSRLASMSSKKAMKAGAGKRKGASKDKAGKNESGKPAFDGPVITDPRFAHVHRDPVGFRAAELALACL